MSAPRRIVVLFGRRHARALGLAADERAARAALYPAARQITVTGAPANETRPQSIAIGGRADEQGMFDGANPTA